MKRDLDLVRAILLALADHPHGFAPAGFTIPGYDQEVIGHHIWLMKDGKLLTGSDVSSFEDASPVAIPGSITWAGHEWIALMRNETVWRKVKAELKDRAISLSFALIQELGTKIVKSLAGLD